MKTEVALNHFGFHSALRKLRSSYRWVGPPESPESSVVRIFSKMRAIR